VAKRPVTTLASADARPRIHFRLRGDTAQVAARGCGPWRPVTDIIEAIDLIAGEDAHRAPAVIIWEGAGHDA
jgi:hypothetical protein